jgi:predicted small integral membrane protein
LVLLLKLNFHLINLFGLYADGKLFNRENVHQIRQIGIIILLFPALWVLGLIIPGFLPAEGLSRTAMTGGQDPFAELIVGGIIIVLAWIMDVGRELREEQDLVV